MSGRLHDWQLEPRDDGKLLLALVAEGKVGGVAHLDIETDRETLKACLQLLESPPKGLRGIQIGKFATCPVTLNHNHDDTISIFVDGPFFHPGRCQSAAIYIDKGDLCGVLREVVAGLQQRVGKH